MQKSSLQILIKKEGENERRPVFWYRADCKLQRLNSIYDFSLRWGCRAYKSRRRACALIVAKRTDFLFPELFSDNRNLIKTKQN